MQKLTHLEILNRQKEKLLSPRLPFCVVLNNIRSLYNVGSIFRTADGAGVEKLWICGITGHPPNNQISKTALGAENQVEWEYRDDASTLISELKEEGYSICMLEQMKESIPFQEFKPQEPVCLVLGNEIEGVGSNLVGQCDHAIEIEMSGMKNSLNVSVAFGIVSYQIRSSLLALS